MLETNPGNVFAAAIPARAEASASFRRATSSSSNLS